MERLKGILDKYGLTKSKAVKDVIDDKTAAPDPPSTSGASGITGPTGFVGVCGSVGPTGTGDWRTSGATGAPGPAMDPVCASAVTSVRTVDSRITTVGVRNAEVVADAATEASPQEEEFEVVCVSTDGLVGSFDVGERYIAKKSPPFLTRIEVFDPYGKWVLCDADCFKATG
jgi:hypothetical protein